MADTPRPSAATDPEVPARKVGTLHVRPTKDMPNGTKDSRFGKDGAVLPANEAQDLIDAGLAVEVKTAASAAKEQ